MPTLTGGQLVAKMLKAEKVSAIFTLSGLHVAPIYAGCVDEGIAVIDTRHEQGAAHAADAYARLTRGIGVAVVTAGPGVTDALTGVANAFAANSPLLLLGGAAPTFNAGKGSLQEIEQVDLFLRITKWADRVPSTAALPAYLARAFRIALSGRPGPVFLELPFDVLMNGADFQSESEALPIGYRTTARSPGDPQLLTEAVRRLDQAERPAVIAGSSIWWDDAVAPLRALAERAGLPVYLNGAARGSLPPEHPNFFQQTRKEALLEADVALVVGTPLDFRLGYGGPETFKPETAVVQVDIDATEVGRNRRIDVGIIGDSRSVLASIAAGVKPQSRAAHLAGLREREKARKSKLDALAKSDQAPLHHFRVAREISEAAKRAGDSMFVADGGNFVAMAAKIIELPRPGRWLDPGPLGCLGVGAPFALAAKHLNPDRPIFVLQGDGSFGLNGFDFETALRFKLPMVVVVGNDAAWGQIRLPQVGMFGEDHSPGTKLAPTRYDKIVEAMGGKGEHVDQPGQLAAALDRAVASGTVACVDVALDPQAPMTSGAMGYAL